MLAEIEGKWELDNSGNVTFVRIIEVPGISKDELFTRGLSYFTYKYNSGDQVIQMKDKEQGVIIGKGIYPKVHVGISIVNTIVDTYHIIRIDVKDGRVRAIVSLTEYRNTISSGNEAPSINNFNVAGRYPISEKDAQKTVMSKAFYYSYQQAMNSLDEIEKTLREGSTGVDTNDW